MNRGRRPFRCSRCHREERRWWVGNNYPCTDETCSGVMRFVDTRSDHRIEVAKRDLSHFKDRRKD